MRPIVFVGFMGAGKSTSASDLGKMLGLDVVDVDSEIKDKIGTTIEVFFSTNGEPKFREIEESETLDAICPDRVVATGGGAVLSALVRERLKQTVCIYMEVSPERAWKRVEGSDRPLIGDRERFFELLNERIELYETVARVVVPAEAPGVMGPLMKWLIPFASPSVHSSLRLAWASASSGDYPVFFGPGSIEVIDELWRKGRAFVLTDTNVRNHYLAGVEELLGDRLVGSYAIEPGEDKKTLAEAERALRAMANAGVTRSDTVVALGGGVVGDLAGFCASTYQRGVAVLQVPTTLMAQVDSAFGGKTGVDLPEAKNYVGTFHQPTAVFVDPDLLDTLPQEELNAGYVEVVKTALIGGGRLWEKVRGDEPVEGMIFDCLRTKLEVVRTDELDLGRRAVLNLGHTVGHAIEAATKYRLYRHGEAVAIGLLVALVISERELGLDKSVRSMVAQLFKDRQLPIACENVPVDDLIERLSYDKKRQDGEPNWVLLASPGDVKTNQQVGDENVRGALGVLNDG